jgi:GH25 family lysozyme M1 (1,4-beta-N-acetylmuramidase)
MKKRIASLLVLCLFFWCLVGTYSVQAGENDVVQVTEQDKETGDVTQKENSWRYVNGERMGEDSTYSFSVFSAWTKVGGVYLNSEGTPIERATKKGMDVSEHQGKIDWEKVKESDIDFVILRCGYGSDETSQDDARWEYNVSECERLGIPYGVYLYSYATSVEMAKSEANHVLRLVEGRYLTYPIYYDLEEARIGALGNAKIGELASTFCNTIQAAGYEVGIYANYYWFTTKLTSEVFSNPTWSKWVAQYNSSCAYTAEYELWQCTSEGGVDGITGNVDLNFMMVKEMSMQSNIPLIASGTQEVTEVERVVSEGYQAKNVTAMVHNTAVQNIYEMVNHRLEDLAKWMGNETLQEAVESDVTQVSYSVQAVLEIEPTDEVAMEADGTYLVTLYLPGLEADDLGVILHYKEEIDGWEWMVPEEVEDGKLTFRTQSFSTFAVGTIDISKQVVIPVTAVVSTPEDTVWKQFVQILGEKALGSVLVWMMLCAATACSLYFVWRRKGGHESVDSV